MALRTLSRQYTGGAAVVTAQTPTSAVNSQSRITGATFGDPAAIVTLQCGCITPAVEKQQDLLAQS